MSASIRFAYVGCRTTRERGARGEGISVFAAPRSGGAWERVQLVPDLLNPSFLAFDRAGRTLYAVHGDSSEMSAFGVNRATGALTFLNQVDVKGKNPVHLAVDPDDRFIVVANHLTAGGHVSSLAVIARLEDGRLGEMTDHVALTGKPGPHRVEQPFAKPHQCQFDPSGRFIAVPDKGLDQITCRRLDKTGRLTPAEGAAAVSREGAGPRHIVFHPALPYAYAVDELSSTVTALRFDAMTGALAPFQVLSCLPDSFVGFSRAAEIDVSPDGRFIYASNRGDDSIAAFSVEPTSGRLTAVGWSGTGGRTPRHFTMARDGGALYVANEESDSIARLARRDDGTLANPQIVAQVGSPTCILFA